MWLNPQFPADLVLFTEKILNGKHHFLSSVNDYFSDQCTLALNDSILPPSLENPNENRFFFLNYNKWIWHGYQKD